ncbi:putative Histidine kinase [Candidatus Moduliflexus flocculans]|uniref:histidine kinase n=1 Tax=Candidatus Moduliflexus flocculans TaxID=1499966 RepID=A0A081BNQ8_9BACT|nr:putative Histidine kinase [Candidatus Moduliflexus flocculans]
MNLDTITELSILYEIASISAKTLDLPQLIEIALEKSVRLLGNDAAAFYLYSSQNHQFSPTNARGIPLTSIVPIEADAVDLAQPCILFQPEAGDGCRLAPLKPPFQMKYAALFPLHYQRRPAAMLLVIRFHGEPFGQTVLQLLSVLRKHVELRLENFYILQEKEDAFNHLFRERCKLEQANATLHQKHQEIERISQDAEAARRAAEFASHAKSEFLANMSHELRTPLNAILGLTRVMLHHPGTPPDICDNLNIIQRSGEHLLKLINDVLDLSKIEAGRMMLTENEFDVYHLLGELKNMFFLRAQEKRLRLSVEIPATIPRYFQADEVKLRQIIINLLNNAIKFTTHGGIAIRVSMKDASMTEASRLIFEIEDTGPGISLEEQEQMFDAFIQTAAGRAIREGTGLGLSISRKFAQLMGGHLSVRSRPGEGATFTVNVIARPVNLRHEAVKQPAEQYVLAVEPGQPTYRLLIVDDHADNRLVLAQLLTPLGFEIREAEHGRDALQIWRGWKPHLIWMDLRMPVMDGYTAIRRIKRTKQGKQTVIIAMTADVVEENREEIFATGCNDYVGKPFQEQEIFHLLEKHLGLKFLYAEDRYTRSEQDKSTLQEWEIQRLREHLDRLSHEQQTALHQAIDAIHIEAIQARIAQIRPQDSALAESLESLVKQYRFDILQFLFEEIPHDSV